MKSKLLLLVFSVVLAYNQVSSVNQTETSDAKKTFYYFAYGSNMLTEHTLRYSPSSKLTTIGKLKDHKLDFFKCAPKWHGCAATIKPSEGDEVWGVVWQMNTSDIPSLDRQEGSYSAKNVNVQTPKSEILECRTYQLKSLPEENVKLTELPPDRQPTAAYMKVCIDGAKEHNIPEEYIEFLRSVRVNDYKGPANYNWENTTEPSVNNKTR